MHPVRPDFPKAIFVLWTLWHPVNPGYSVEEVNAWLAIGCRSNDALITMIFVLSFLRFLAHLSYPKTVAMLLFVQAKAY